MKIFTKFVECGELIERSQTEKSTVSIDNKQQQTLTT